MCAVERLRGCIRVSIERCCELLKCSTQLAVLCVRAGEEGPVPRALDAALGGQRRGELAQSEPGPHPHVPEGGASSATRPPRVDD